MELKLSQPFGSLSMIFDRFQPLLLSAQHRSTVKFAFLCLLHYSHYQGLCSARTIWQFCSGKRDPTPLLHRHSNAKRGKNLGCVIEMNSYDLLDVLGKDLLKQRASTRWFHLGSSSIPVWKPCMLYWCSDILICGALHTYRKRKRSLNTEMAQQRLAFNTANMGGGVPTSSGRSGRPHRSTLWV